MFIILEGTDASGKSTLAAEIEAQLQFRGTPVDAFHTGPPSVLSRAGVLNEYAISIEGYNLQSETIVADRWHWGEVTYAPTKRPDTNTDGFGLLGVAGWRWVELFLESRGAAQVWVNQPLHVLQARLSSRGDDFVQTAELAGIYDRYRLAAASVHSLAYEATPSEGADGVRVAASRIISIAHLMSELAGPISAFPEYIGPIKPKVLLIGDKRNDPTVTCLPFMPVNSNSGDFLLSALPESLWRHVGIVNAGDVYGPRLTELHSVLGEPRVIALGRMAEREVRSSGLHIHDYTVLPHPQYVRRFHHHDRFEYGFAIESFATGSKLNNERFAHWVLP